MNLKSLFFLAAALCGLTRLSAQDVRFEAVVSRDTVLLGNALRITFTIENTEGSFTPPDFKDFAIVGGPSQSSSFSMINGVTTQSASYTYYIEPKSTGRLRIEPAELQTDSGKLKTEAIRIFVKENPDGVHENAEPGSRLNPYSSPRPKAPAREEPRPKAFEKTYKL